ncbi:phosphatase PAP2 family protein [Bacteroides sp. HF-5092]|uniref:phosphatase PAP2 family protein n=1 Tax=Bacteroides TaxID=816 RepID=UPI001177BD59|nr:MULTISPECIES: phosphatase PAP2 family protein [Bacteroides]TRX47843.1 phosphatase PAP2 family protein [Bacteroides sp. HF-5092]
MKQMSFFICLFFTCLLCMPLKGQIRDSLERDSSYTPLHHHIWNSKAYQITHIGAPLILAGVLTYHKDKAFQNIRNSYIPRFRFHYDDYLQYSPGIVMLGLKSFGVEGRSSWGRMLTSDAFSAGIMALTVNTLKSTIHKERPDKSADNSFPSGHTATAFMFATMLHKEYGTTRSPLYSVLGYSLATGTALSRQMNNKHWFSDVLTGAGIGIVSTELGYYLADLIFKNKGIVRPPRTWNVSQDDSYSFFGLQMGYNIGEREMHLPEGIEIEGMGGAIASFNGAWFFRSHWGVGGKFTVAQTSPHVASDRFFSYHPETEAYIENFEAESMNYASLAGGIYYNACLCPDLHIGGSVLGGVGWSSSYRARIRYKGQETTDPLIHCTIHPIPNIDFSVYLMHATGQNFGVKLFLNYNTGIGKGNYTYYAPQADRNPSPVTDKTRYILHNFNIGFEIDALFWK